MAKHRFASMGDMARDFQGIKKSGANLPLMDDSPADAWMSCGTSESRAADGEAWKTERAEYGEPMEVRDFKILLAYEADGAKLEAAFGWSALGMWLTALRSYPASMMEETAMEKRRHISKMEILIKSGACVSAFQAAYPDALAKIVNACGVAEEAGWELVEILLKNGWRPNEWNPLSRGGASGSMHSLFEECETFGAKSADGAELDQSVAMARWQRAAQAAQRAGFHLDSRNREGLTALGLCLATRRRAASKNIADPRIEALLNAGARPELSAKFWLSAMEADPTSQQALAARMEAAQIGESVGRGEHPAHGPRVATLGPARL